MQWLARRMLARALAAAEPVTGGRTAEWRAAVVLAGLSGRRAQLGGVGVLLGLADELIFSRGLPSLIVRIPIAAITSVEAARSFSIPGKLQARTKVVFVIVEWADGDGASHTIVVKSADAEGLRKRLEALRVG